VQPAFVHERECADEGGLQLNHAYRRNERYKDLSPNNLTSIPTTLYNSCLMLGDAARNFPLLQQHCHHVQVRALNTDTALLAVSDSQIVNIGKTKQSADKAQWIIAGSRRWRSSCRWFVWSAAIRNLHGGKTMSPSIKISDKTLIRRQLTEPNIIKTIRKNYNKISRPQ
jgi:hypothetical protein